MSFEGIDHNLVAGCQKLATTIPCFEKLTTIFQAGGATLSWYFQKILYLLNLKIENIANATDIPVTIANKDISITILRKKQRMSDKIQDVKQSLPKAQRTRGFEFQT